MPKSRHARAVDIALATNDKLAGLFARVGNAQHPRGAIVSAYRIARRALNGQLGNFGAVRETLSALRAQVQRSAAILLSDSQAMGQGQAVANLAVYGIESIAPPAGEFDPALDAILEPLDTQITQVEIYSRLQGAGAQTLVLGDDTRQGVLTPGPVITEANHWIAWAAIGSFWGVIQSAQTDDIEFYKQAIAAIDERTTDCCLRVNGQAVPLNKKFKLTGTPRFADSIENPPFHYYCRTAEALVPADEVDDELTREMRAASLAELKARAETKARKEITPADARSRRK